MGGGVSLPRKSSETWSAAEVAALLNSMGYAEYAKAAEKNDLSGMELLKMNTAELEDALGCTKAEHATKILNELEKFRALSLGEEKSLMDGQENQRRTSMLAMSTEEKIRDAEPGQRCKMLLDALVAEAGKRDAGEPEFASWGLSSISELSQGQMENRQYFVGENACQLVLDIMGFFPNDIFVQWQGCHCIGVLCASSEAADKFGGRALEAVVGCMSRTDVADLGFTGIRALKNLVSFSDSNLEQAKRSGAVEVLQGLMEEFDYNQFRYSGQLLIQQIKESGPNSRSEEKGAE